MEENPKTLFRLLPFHIVYWLFCLVLFAGGYTVIGTVLQGLWYGLAMLPFMILISAGLTYRITTRLYFRGRRILFALVVLIMVVLLLNVVILLAFGVRVYFPERFDPDIWLLRQDILYLSIVTLFLSLPAIFFGMVRKWRDEKERSETVLKERDELQNQLEEIEEEGESTLTVKSDGKHYQLREDEIRYIEGMGDYVLIYLSKRRLITRITLKKLDQKLDRLIRIHRSYLVNPQYCEYYSSQEVKLQGRRIPVGRTYRDAVLDYFKQEI